MTNHMPTLPREIVEVISDYDPETFLLLDKRFYKKTEDLRWRFTMYKVTYKFMSNPVAAYRVNARRGSSLSFSWTHYDIGNLASPRLFLPPRARCIPLSSKPFIIGDEFGKYFFDPTRQVGIGIYRAGPFPGPLDIPLVSFRWYIADDHDFMVTLPEQSEDTTFDFCVPDIAFPELGFYVQAPERLAFENATSTNRMPECRLISIKKPKSGSPSSPPERLILKEWGCDKLSWDEVNRAFGNCLTLLEWNEEDKVSVLAEITDVTTGATAHVYVKN
jgi:hypothetical protein